MVLVAIGDDCRACQHSRALVNEIMRDNSAAELRLVELDPERDADELARLGVVSHPALILLRDGERAFSISGVATKRRVLHRLLPVLYRDERAATEHLRSQVGSTSEEFPRRGRSSFARIRLDQKSAALRRVPLFDGMSQRDLKRVGRMTDEVLAPAGKLITEQGAPGDEFFVLTKGRAAVEIDDAIIGALAEGECFGEMSLVDGEPRSASVRALEDSQLVVLSRRDFDQVLEAWPSITRTLLAALSRRVRALEQTPR